MAVMGGIKKNFSTLGKRVEAMFPSLKIAKVFGINVFIHWTFWLLPLWVIFTWEGSAVIPLWMNLLIIAALFACIVLHELGHALTAQHFGIRTRNITLSPLGGIAQLERMSRNPWEEFCIAIAGPLVNVVIAMVLGVFVLGAFGFLPNAVDSLAWRFVSVLLALNVVMVVFNLIPAFPMDGGRVLRAILASSMGLLPATRVAVVVGTLFAVVMGVVGVFVLGNPWLMLIALFVIWAGHQELAALEAEARGNLDEEPVSHVTLCLWDPVHRQWVRRMYMQREE